MEFINLLQGGMSVHDYSLKFIQFSKYAPSLVSDTRQEMGRFVMGLLGDFQEECDSSMLHDNINISRLMVHARRVEVARKKERILMLNGKDVLLKVHQGIGLRYKTSLGLISRFQVKFLLSYQSLVVIGCLPLI